MLRLVNNLKPFTKTQMNIKPPICYKQFSSHLPKTNNNSTNNNSTNDNSTDNNQNTINIGIEDCVIYSGFIGGMYWSMFENKQKINYFVKNPLSSIFVGTMCGVATSFATFGISIFMPSIMALVIPLSVGMSIGYNTTMLINEDRWNK